MQESTKNAYLTAEALPYAGFKGYLKALYSRESWSHKISKKIKLDLTHIKLYYNTR